MTAAPETNRAWLRKLITGVPHMVIGGAEDPYLLRWYLIPRNPFVNVYLHKFLRSDDDRALHLVSADHADRIPAVAALLRIAASVGGATKMTGDV